MNRRDILQAMFAAPATVPRSRAAMPLAGDDVANDAMLRRVSDETQLIEALGDAIAGPVGAIEIVAPIVLSASLYLAGLVHSLRIFATGTGALSLPVGVTDPVLELGPAAPPGDPSETRFAASSSTLRALHIDDLELTGDGPCIRLSTITTDGVYPHLHIRRCRMQQHDPLAAAIDSIDGTYAWLWLRDCYMESIDIDAVRCLIQGCDFEDLLLDQRSGIETADLRVADNRVGGDITLTGAANARAAVTGNTGTGTASTVGVAGPKANVNNPGMTIVL